MFIHRESDPAGAVLIPQASHAWMAWQVADHWGNRRFPRPAPRAETLAAVFLHDGGWSDYDALPEVDAQGRPVTFDRMPVGPHLEIWRRSILRAAAISRYAGVLVASHFLRLLELKGEDDQHHDDQDLRLIESFRAEMGELVSATGRQLESDARYAEALAGEGLERNAGILAAADQVSVYLCASLPSPFSAAVQGREGQCHLTVREVGPRRWRVQPWPFAGDRVRLQCEGKRLLTTTFASRDALAAALAEAPTVRLEFTLLRPSAVGR